MEKARRSRQHFLLLTHPAQGNINPILHLANRLPAATGALATFAVPESAYRRMFHSSPDRQVDDGGVSYISIPDGFDEELEDSSQFGKTQFKLFIAQFKLVGPQSLSDLVAELAARGRPVTCIIYTFLQPWAEDVAQKHGIPSSLYWIQPAFVFSIYYHYFHGHDGVVAMLAHDPMSIVELPWLPPLQIRDLPSFLTMSPDDPYYSAAVAMFKELFEAVDKQKTWPKPKVLVNTLQGLEEDGIASVDKLELVAVGPLVPSWSIDGDGEARGRDDISGDLTKPDEKKYMEWLETKLERSVVYVSFGSYATIKKRQMEEIIRGLMESGRPYLMVVRKENRGEVEVELEGFGGDGMVVEWCSQVRVLMHPAVGCFVTHCGWNSTMESLVCGVPTVCVPQWIDQMTNAKLVELWRTGVRGAVNEEGVLEWQELKRCLEIVMGEGEEGEELRKNARKWSREAKDAMREGGSSHKNLEAFVEAVAVAPQEHE